MAARPGRDMTLEEFDARVEARRNVAEATEAGCEEGGPRGSLVPTQTSVLIDILPDAVDLPVPAPAGLHALPFALEPSRQVGGWSAARQRTFIESLVETGSVHLSAKSAGLSARSAYGQRIRSAAYRRWRSTERSMTGSIKSIVTAS